MTMKEAVKMEKTELLSSIRESLKAEQALLVDMALLHVRSVFEGSMFSAEQVLREALRAIWRVEALQDLESRVKETPFDNKLDWIYGDILGGDGFDVAISTIEDRRAKFDAQEAVTVFSKALIGETVEGSLVRFRKLPLVERFKHMDAQFPDPATIKQLDGPCDCDAPRIEDPGRQIRRCTACKGEWSFLSDNAARCHSTRAG
jgi:hypothetical protein